MSRGSDYTYRKLRKEVLSKKPMCIVRVPGCSLRATDYHHPSGHLGGHYLRSEEFIPCCRSCHSFLELNPVIAKELGFSKSRLSNNGKDTNNSISRTGKDRG